MPTLSPSERRDLALLEQAADSPSQIINWSFVTLASQLHDHNAVLEAAQSLVARGLADNPDVRETGPAGIRVTPQGLLFLQEITAQRQDIRAREVALREALLTWLDEEELQGHTVALPDDFTASRHDDYLGQPFPIEAVSRVVRRLREERLVEGIETWGEALVQAQLTAVGRRAAQGEHNCVGNLAPNTTTVVINNAVNSPVMVNSDGSTQSVMTAEQLHQEVATALAPISDAIDSLQLTPTQASKLKALLDDASSPTAASTPGKLRVTLNEIVETVRSGSAKALGNAVLASILVLVSRLATGT
jgi:hypothetical protein